MAHAHRSVKPSAFLAVAFGWLAVTGCSPDNSQALVGTWRTDVIKSEWGSNRITVCYLADGTYWQSNAFAGGAVLGAQGTYQVRRGTLLRTQQGTTKNQEIAFRISGDRMHQTLGLEEYTLTRIGTEPNAAGNQSQAVPSGTNLTSAAAGSGR